MDPLLAPGRYELRYIYIQPNGNGTVVARSAPLNIGLSGFTLAASPSLISTGGKVSVDWTAASGRTGRDIIGLFKVGSSSDKPISSRYTLGAANGNFTMKLPANTGLYEFRYIFGTAASSGFLEAANSNVITVQ